MIYLFLAALRARVRCCWRSRARAFIALDRRPFTNLVGVGSVTFFKLIPRDVGVFGSWSGGGTQVRVAVQDQLCISLVEWLSRTEWR